MSRSRRGGRCGRNCGFCHQYKVPFYERVAQPLSTDFAEPSIAGLVEVRREGVGDHVMRDRATVFIDGWESEWCDCDSCLQIDCDLEEYQAKRAARVGYMALTGPLTEWAQRMCKENK